MSFLENFKKRREFLLTPLDHSRKTGIIFFFISLFLHGLFFYSIIFFQDFKLPKPLPPVIQIDLVSFSPEPLLEEPAKNEENSKKDGIPVKSQIIKKKSRKISTIKPDISLKTKPKNLKDLMAQQEKKPVKKEKPKKQIDSEKVLEEAREKLEKKVENQNQIAQALSRLQKKVKDQGKSKEGEKKGAYAGAGKKGYKPIDLYKMVLGQTIEQNWVFNDILARMDQNFEVRILIKILKSGEIRDIIYETKSGNRYLDESAKKAIKKANPLPQLPGGMRSYDVVVIFTPKGLK
ncbi:energy transducer TonB [Desulfobacula sp.]|uniref:energy transducer TonB n=1 Tax=Desulfobacula sp. TaxID=2593537 RepID=UPI00260D308A|nr:TonB family protein [Desulfobacula sp.]